jgi:hypothetical protein
MDDIGVLSLNKKLSLPHPDNPSAELSTGSMFIYSDCTNRPLSFYPEMERRAGIGGGVLVGFLLDHNGDILGIQIVKSSGNAAFDQAAPGVCCMRKLRLACSFSLKSS